jgi:hypothetical protein
LSDTANAATEVVAEVAEEVAEHATALAQTSRGFSGHDAGLVFGSLVVGAGIGGALCYIFAKRQLETKYSKIAAEEVAQMREHYAAKIVVLGSLRTVRATLIRWSKIKGMFPQSHRIDRRCQ